MTDLKIVPVKSAGKPLTIESLAAIKFKGAKSLLKQTTKEQRTDYLHSLALAVYQSAAIAGEQCIRDKAEVVQMARDNIDLFGPALMELKKASECAAQLLEIVRAGEIRLAVALAILKSEKAA
jgi:hypothetical protein